YEENDQFDKDVVFAQSPEPGTRVEEGEEVTLTVSGGRGNVAVADVTGQSLDDAEIALEDAGFDVRARPEASDTVPRGAVIRTEPPAGTEAVRGSEVTIFFSSGVELVSVPDVTGLSEVAAARELGAADLNVETASEASDTVEEGLVIRTEPPANSSVAKGSTVRLVVSSGVEEVQVPSVVNQTEESATGELEALGFTVEVEFVTTTNPSRDGLVLSQTPQAGTSLPRGSTVTIQVSEFLGGGGGGNGGSTSTTTSTTSGSASTPPPPDGDGILPRP
ncbi:MAG: PASTA domain-containing protein, partial [Acidimicrobiia bacterium]